MWHGRRTHSDAESRPKARRTIRTFAALAAAAALAFGNLTVGLWAEPAPAEAAGNVGNSRVQYPVTWYTYINKGERVKTRFETTQDAATGKPMRTKIVVTAPDGTVMSDCENVFAVGGVCEYDSGPVTDAQKLGAWSVAMVPNGENPPETGYGRNQMYWQVEARTGAGTHIPGRVWTDAFAMEDRNKLDVLSLWYQTEFGYTYSIDFHKFRGINSWFDANAFGNVNSETCASAYQSLAGTVHNNARPEYMPVTESSCTFSPDKIFFERPDATMPTQVKLPNGTTTWLMVPLTDPEISIHSFESKPAGSRSGTFKLFARGFEGNAEVYIDTNNDGRFDEPGVDVHANVAMVRSTEAVAAGWGSAGTFEFDGRDGAGKKIAQNTPIAFRAAIEKVGEVHFLLNDVEELDNGIVVTRHNGLRSQGQDTTVYWNDEPMNDPSWDRQALKKCGTPPAPLQSDQVNGTPSAGKVRGWDAFECGPNTNNSATNLTNGGSWGNNRAIDTWAFEHLTQGKPIHDTMDIPGFKIEKLAETPNPDNPAEFLPLDHLAVVNPGTTIKYSVIASPVLYANSTEITRPATFWTGRYSDDVTGVADDATIDYAPLTITPNDPPAESTAGWASDKQLWTWEGSKVPLTTAVTTSYTAVVNDLDPETNLPTGDGHLLNVAFAHEEKTPPPFPEACIEQQTELCDTTEQLVPALQVKKSSKPIRESSVVAGDDVTYTLEFHNGGAGDATVNHTDYLETVLDDATLKGAIVLGGDAPGGITAALEGDNRIVVTGTLPAGKTATVTYTVTVKGPNEQGEHPGDGVLTNFVVPDGEDEGEVPTDCADGDLTCTTHFVPQISLEKSFANYSDEDHSESITVGDLLSYSFVVTNTGPVTLTDIVLNDPKLVAGVDCAGTQLEPGASMACEALNAYEVTEADAKAQEVLNTATVTGVSIYDPEKKVSDEDSEVVPIESVDLRHALEIEKRLSAEHGTLDADGEVGTGIEDVNESGRVDAGDLIWYAFTVTNIGPIDLEHIAVVDGLLSDSGIEIECETTELARGESTNCAATSGYEITPEDVSAGSRPNTAHATGKSTITNDGVTSPEVDHDVPLVVNEPALVLKKTVAKTLDHDSSDSLTVGDGIIWEFEATNVGNAPLHNLVVDDPMLTAAGLSVLCPETTLEVAASVTCVSTPEYRVTEADREAGKIVNVAIAETDETSSNESSTTTPVGPLAESGASATPALAIGAGLLALLGAVIAARGARRKATR